MNIINRNNNTWIIEDEGVRCFLLEGTKTAALIDTGMHIKNLKETVESLTDKEIIVLNTHADRDHIGSNHLFNIIFVGIHEMAFYCKQGLSSNILGLYGKDTIDLGDRILEVIDLPGHTPGSIAFYDINNKILISGDSIQRNGRIFMFGEQRNMVAYLSSLERLNIRKGDFVEIWPSHSELPLQNNSIQACIDDANDLLDGNLEYEIKENDGVRFRIYQGKHNMYLLDDKD